MVVELGIDFENVEGDTKIEKALELALRMSRRGRLKELLETLAEKRPFVDWDEFV